MAATTTVIRTAITTTTAMPISNKAASMPLLTAKTGWPYTSAA